MTKQFNSFVAEYPFTSIVNLPVSVGNPAFIFLGMSEICRTSQSMSFHLDYLLDLPGVSVSTCTQVERNISLSLDILASGISCPHCRKHMEQVHQNRLLLRDLPSFGYEKALGSLAVFRPQELFLSESLLTQLNCMASFHI